MTKEAKARIKINKLLEDARLRLQGIEILMQFIIFEQKIKDRIAKVWGE